MTPLATDGRIALRRYRPDDVEPLYAAGDESRASIGRWRPWCHEHCAYNDALAWVAGRELAWVKNVASRRTAERSGARFEAVCRNRLMQWDRWHDAALYGLMPADLESAR